MHDPGLDCRGTRCAIENNSEAIAPRRKEEPMYSILYIIGAIVVIVVVLRLLGLY
jgi:uncharacterized membrane protein YkgB